MAINYNFWLLYFYCFVALAVIYLIKFLSLKFFGVALQYLPRLLMVYIFIVFMINKIIGVYIYLFWYCLHLQTIIYTRRLLFFLISGFLHCWLTALFLSYSLVQNEIRLNPFSFLFISLCLRNCSAFTDLQSFIALVLK